MSTTTEQKERKARVSSALRRIHKCLGLFDAETQDELLHVIRVTLNIERGGGINHESKP